MVVVMAKPDGAWLVSMQYVGSEKRAVYPLDLPPQWRKRVLHTMVNGDCAIIGAGKNDKVTGALWDSDFKWPDPPPPPFVIEAPANEKAVFLAAVNQLCLSFTENIVGHLNTHEASDSVMEAYGKLLETLSRGP